MVHHAQLNALSAELKIILVSTDNYYGQPVLNLVGHLTQLGGSLMAELIFKVKYTVLSCLRVGPDGQAL